MGLWIAVIAIVIVVVVAAVAATILVRRRKASRDAQVAAPPPVRPAAPPAAPMNDLESALAKVTDREGRPIRERIDAESAHVDPLRDPEDTGPLLRRALDSVVPHDEDPPVDDAEAGERPA